MGERNGPVVAVDGPSGTGKSTVSRRLAQRIGAQYLDTGAMYRAVTLAVIEAGVDPRDTDQVAKIASTVDVGVGTDADAPHISLGGRRVDTEIRGEQVTAHVSAVAAVPEVRRILVALQKEHIASARTAGGIVVEGRDIGSVVAPDASVKVYLTASAEERARRRSTERSSDLQATAQDMARRDHHDSTRATDPLAKAPGAVEIDTTRHGIDEVVELIFALLPGYDG